MTNTADLPSPPTHREQERCRVRRTKILDSLLQHVVSTGRYQLSLKEIVGVAGLRHTSTIANYFGGSRLAMSCLARHDAGKVVASLGLSERAFVALSDRDVKTLATAVLAGRRAEHP